MFPIRFSYCWMQALTGEWTRKTMDVEKLMSVKNLRKFDFEPGNHIGTVEPPSSRLRANDRAENAEAENAKDQSNETKSDQKDATMKETE